jgi:hypothetical protein
MPHLCLCLSIQWQRAACSSRKHWIVRIQYPNESPQAFDRALLTSCYAPRGDWMC